jgi:hypothetical protein
MLRKITIIPPLHARQRRDWNRFHCTHIFLSPRRIRCWGADKREGNQKNSTAARHLSLANQRFPRESLGTAGLSDVGPAKPDWSVFCVPLRPKSCPGLVIKGFCHTLLLRYSGQQATPCLCSCFSQWMATSEIQIARGCQHMDLAACLLVYRVALAASKVASPL